MYVNLKDLIHKLTPRLQRKRTLARCVTSVVLSASVQVGCLMLRVDLHSVNLPMNLLRWLVIQEDTLSFRYVMSLSNTLFFPIHCSYLINRFVQTLESPEIKMLFPGLKSPEKRHRSWKTLEKSWNSKVVVLEILHSGSSIAP